MDFSPLNEALVSKSYDKIAEILDELMLQAATDGVPYQDEWPYSIHLLGHIIANDINSARFLWKSIPGGVKESRTEVAAVWRIGQQLWLRDYAAVHEAVRGFDWSAELRDLVVAFSGRVFEKFHLGEFRHYFIQLLIVFSVCVL